MNTAKRILVIDDDHDIRDVMRMVLEMEGFEVNELDNGHNVEAEIQRYHPDVILLDVMLGDMDGRDICRDLKGHVDTRVIPIIIVSATHGWHTLQEKRCGANDYLSKPFDIFELAERVRKQLAA